MWSKTYNCVFGKMQLINMMDVNEKMPRLWWLENWKSSVLKSFFEKYTLLHTWQDSVYVFKVLKVPTEKFVIKTSSDRTITRDKIQ